MTSTIGVKKNIVIYMTIWIEVTKMMTNWVINQHIDWYMLGTWQCLGSGVKNMIEENIEEKVKQDVDTCLPFMNLLRWL